MLIGIGVITAYRGVETGYTYCHPSEGQWAPRDRLSPPQAEAFYIMTGNPCKVTPSYTDAYAQFENHQLRFVASAILRVRFGHKAFSLSNLRNYDLCLRSLWQALRIYSTTHGKVRTIWIFWVKAFTVFSIAHIKKFGIRTKQLSYSNE